MKAFFLLGVALALSGCVTTAPVGIGNGAYRVETLGTNMTLRPALEKATEFCAQQSKGLQLLTSTQSGVGIGANSAITFACIARE